MRVGISICVRVCVTESSAVWSRGPALSETARQRYSRITADIWADWDSLKTCPYCWDWYNEINRCGGGHTHTSRHLTDTPRDVCHAQRHSRGSTNFSDAQIYTNCMHTLKHISTPNDPQLFMCTDTIAKPCQTHFSHKHSIQTQTTPKPSKIDNSTGRTLIVYCSSSVAHTSHFQTVTPHQRPYFCPLPLGALRRCNRLAFFL